MLQVRLLGQFDLSLNKKRITIPSRVGQSLFAYLVLGVGTSHRREKLAGMFWPDTTEETARKYLRQELWRIRKALAPSQKDAVDYLLADEFTIAFNRNADYWLDVSQVERPDQDLESLTGNLAFYQGELLPGFYEDWVVLERERLQSIFDNKMGQLLEQLVTSERWTAVQEQGERWLTLGNTPEPAFRALMLAYGARGDMTKVSSVYQRCIAALDEQFGIEPSAETRALYEGLLKGTRVSSRPSAQPSSTVTFLFTDIESSTNLLDSLGDQYAEVLEDHHEIMRTAIRKWNGKEVDTQGDSFFVTFTRALDALQCAAEMQRALQSHPWVENKAPRVRMGLHTGEPLIGSTGYVGMDVHRAARIGDAAHGGQILLSQTTRELVMHDLPKGTTIRDLGEHRLKDLKFPTPIYQLIIEGLPFDFPPVRTKFTGTEVPTPGEPPFKGLQYFDEADCDLFFGRELLTEKLINRLRESRFLSVIVGASGSGKSSLVRAGLIPALRNEQNKDWLIYVITPTAHPLEALATELTRESESVTATATLIDDLLQDPRSLSLFLARQNPKRHRLLVIDQFEELFTLCRDEFEREAFIDNLLTTLDQDRDTCTLVLTLRADFYAHLAQYPELREAVANHQEYIGPMSMEELRRAIEEPAKRGHWAFEPGLVDLILRDVGDEPGALPLLSHALLETWKRRAGHTLTLKGYADAGGVHGAIAHTAENVYQNLSAEEQTIARDIFLRLTELGEGTEDTRRRASFEELMSDPETREEVRRVLNVLAEARLVTLSEDTAEVAHEALIREWPTLREWLNQDREGLQLHRRLTEATHEWELLERDEGVLYRGAQLAQAREWAALHANALNSAEKAFIEVSNALEQNEIAEREAQRQRELEAAQKLAETERRSVVNLRGRNRIITVIGSVALVLAILASLFGVSSSQNAQQAFSAQATSQVEAQNRATAEANAVSERNFAQQQSSIAFMRELSSAANVNLDIDPERSILLALQAVAITNKTGQLPPVEVQEALHRAVQASRVQATLHGHTAEVMGIAYSSDGKRLATIADDNTIRIWDTASGKSLITISTGELPQNIYHSISFSPDATRLAASASDNMAKIWDAVSGKELLVLKGHTDLVTAAIFSPDGKWIATTSADQTTKIWDATTGQEVLTLIGQNDQVNDVAFSPDEKYIATAGESTGAMIWDATSGKPLFTLPVFDGVTAVVFSPDGKTLATAAYNTTWSLWDVATGQKLLTQYGHASLVVDIAFDSTGERIVTASEDGTAKIWDTATGRELFALLGHASGVMGATFSPDRNHIATASRDTTVKIWDVSPNAGSEWFNLVGHADRVYDAVYSPDGKYIATAGIDSKTKLWDAITGKELNSFTTDNSIWTVIFSPDGTRLFASNSNLSDTGAIHEWNVATGKELFNIPLNDFSGRLALSPDGLLLATGGLKGAVTIWNAQTGKKLLAVADQKDFVQYLAFSPDGKRLASTNADKTVEVLDTVTGKELLSIKLDTSLSKVAFSPDGKLIAISGNDAAIHILDSMTGKELHTLTGHTGPTFGVAFSPDGQYLATSSVDRTVKIWNVADNFTSLPLTLYAHTRAIYSVVFSPDGTRILTASRDTTARVYAFSLEDLIKIAQSHLTRHLTTQECQQYLHINACPSEP
jgi:WD40 repeat protein/class 3 adenylate cyclase